MNVNPKQRTEYIGIRVTPKEKAIIQKAAEDFNTSVTELMIFSTMIEAQRLYKIQAQLAETIDHFTIMLRRKNET